MGRYLKQEQSRTELQERIIADLRAKATASGHDDNNTTPPTFDASDSDQSEYLKGTKQTTALAWAWLVVGLLALLTFGFFVAITLNSY